MSVGIDEEIEKKEKGEIKKGAPINPTLDVDALVFRVIKPNH